VTHDLWQLLQGQASHTPVLHYDPPVDTPEGEECVFLPFSLIVGWLRRHALARGLYSTDTLQTRCACSRDRYKNLHAILVQRIWPARPDASGIERVRRSPLCDRRANPWNECGTPRAVERTEAKWNIEVGRVPSGRWRRQSKRAGVDREAGRQEAESAPMRMWASAGAEGSIGRLRSPLCWGAGLSLALHRLPQSSSACLLPGVCGECAATSPRAWTWGCAPPLSTA